jgi:hypothetical protein
MGETILIQWECSNVLYHFISFLLVMLIWFQFLAIQNILNSSDHNQVNKTTTVKALFSGRCQKSQNLWPGSELPCANQYPLNVWNKNWKKKKLFWSTLTWPSIWVVGATFFFEHLIDVFCYLLSFCYLLAEWLAVNTHICSDQISGLVCSQWSLLWWLLKGEPIPDFPTTVLW